jgi:hypothetical protein
MLDCRNAGNCANSRSESRSFPDIADEMFYRKPDNERLAGRTRWN